MKINTLDLYNFCGASRLTVQCHKQLNVFVGINGSGKSTILDAASIGLSWIVKRIERTHGRGRYIPDSNLRNGENEGSLSIQLIEQENVFNWLIAKEREGTWDSKLTSDLVQSKALATQLREVYQQEKTWPVISYYPVRRVVDTINPKVSENYGSHNLDVYESAMDGKTTYQTFFEWFRVQDDILNEKTAALYQKELQRKEKRDKGRSSAPALKTVSQAIEKFLPGYTNLRVTRLPRPRMLVDKDGVTLNMEQLSDGEKNLIALVGDIARRLTIGNSRSLDPLAGNGIILIDEIDLHLHPKWQRRVVPQLMKIFPNCQFFISTHSPQVIAHIQPESVFLLEQDNDGITYTHPESSYGMSTDRVLELVMGDEARPIEIEARLDTLFELIDLRKFAMAEKLLSELKGHMEFDPEIIRAEIMIRSARIQE